VDLGLKEGSVVVAGSSQGIGRGIAEMFAAEGARVVVHGRNTDLIGATVEKIHSSGGVAIGCAADLTVADGAQRLVESAVRNFGGVDVLVVNSGGPRAGGFGDLSDQDWLDAFELNILSAVRLVRQSLPHLRQSRRGRVVQIASTAIKQPIPGIALTNGVRPGLVGLMKTLADELGPDGITANTILCGSVYTERLDYLWEERAKAQGKTGEQVRAEALAAIPLGRLGLAEDIAGLAVFLASAQAAWITGTVTHVDGGRMRGSF
jgi:3-oxoacyl-[acyl-carrier protein] reductase